MAEQAYSRPCTAPCAVQGRLHKPCTAPGAVLHRCPNRFPGKIKTRFGVYALKRKWETPIKYTTIIIDPSRGLIILGVYGRLVYTLCHVHNSRVQRGLHTKTTPQGREAPLWSAAKGCAFVVLFFSVQQVPSL